MIENKIRHLEMIQGVINRMASNSFMLKGWSVILVSALFALSASDSRIQFILLAWFPALVFWGLDAYYLRQERLFRRLYDVVRKLNESEIDFSMDTSAVDKNVDPWLSVLNSKTLKPFHGTIVVTIFIVAIFSL